MRHRSWIVPILLLALVACAVPLAEPDPPAIETAPPTFTPIPTATPVPVSLPVTIFEPYTVRKGETLGAISARYDVAVDDLMKLNGLTNPNALQAGQILKIPILVTRAAPGDYLLPDSEVVYSPAYESFDVAAFVSQRNGYLASYRDKADGEMLTGAQIIQLVSERYSVGPRVLLALLEFESGWVTNASVTQNQLTYPMGLQDASRQGLFYQASVVANRLNEGYYGKLTGRLQAYKFKNGTRALVAPGANPGTVAVQNVLAQMTNWDTWQTQIASDGVIAAYRGLFGDPNAFAIKSLVPPDVKQPNLRLPWNNGGTWYFTGGPHSAWGDLGAWSAIDLTPSDVSGAGTCYASRDWAVAAAPGRVLASEHGRVVVSLGNGNFQGSGWSLLYMHIATNGRVSVGAQVNTGDRIGHPSCEGGNADASHLHFARLYNGQWIDPNTVPFILSDWHIDTLVQEYDGKMTRDADTREAVNGRDESKNAIVAK